MKQAGIGMIRTGARSLAALCIGLSLCLSLATAVHAQGKWTKLAPFPEPSEELMGEAAGGKMYVFAGLAPGWKPKALVYEYDPANDRWTKKKPMALPSHHVAFAEYNGKIYADNEINYFGIGMYENWAGDSLSTAKWITRGWKWSQYHEGPSDNTYYWLTKGYNDYSSCTTHAAQSNPGTSSTGGSLPSGKPRK